MTEQRKIVTNLPENSETPLDSVCSWVTPTRLFFVRNHFDVPAMELENWKLTIGGLVDIECSLSYTDLEAMPQHTVFSTMECAGNGRSYLTVKQHGVQWGAGAIAHAEWTGVPLYHVLNEIGVKPTTTEIIFEGADSGVEGNMTEPIPFERSLPIDKAMDRNTILALRMNGEPLTIEHGYPVRLLVPGWYGVASVKWLTRMTAVDKPFDGHYQTEKYTIKKQTADGVKVVGVQQMAVKSEIIRPKENERLGIGTQRIFGVAWAGEDSVQRVEISTDGGMTWSEANLIGLQAPYSWALWEYFWEVVDPGTYSIMARATSSSDQVQPVAHDFNRGGYMINFVRPRTVQIDKQVSHERKDFFRDAQVLVYDMNAFAETNASVPLDVFVEHSDGAGI